MEERGRKHGKEDSAAAEGEEEELPVMVGAVVIGFVGTREKGRGSRRRGGTGR